MYTALYRKLRPRRFADIVDQEHIVRTLKNQIITNKASHAYLFCGTRGTGKTTTALVFAKAVNCEKPENGESCGVCATCKAISQADGFNIIEIDAASNNGVDNIRDIREEVKYPPAEGRYKVYIIDEAHMLTVSAFNALLKTLEEPPPGVIFILATTEAAKIPPTIHSRCQRFDFRRIPMETMAQTVGGYLKDEGIECDMDALRYTARIADGSMRDILSIMDRCAAYSSGERITLSTVMEVTGAIGSESLGAILSSMRGNDAGKCLEIIDGLVKNGKDVHQLASEFLSYLRDSLIAVTAGAGAARILEVSEDIVETLRENANTPVPLLTHIIETFGELISGMRYARNPRVLLEAACIAICRASDKQVYFK